MTDRVFYNLQKIIVPLAIFFILFVSTGNYGYLAYVNNQNSFLFYPQIIFSVIAAAGPNLLLMSLGAYQFSHKSQNEKVAKTIVAIVLGIVIFSLLTYCYALLTTNNFSAFGWNYFFTRVVSSSFSSYNIIYVILGVLVTLPLLQLFADHANLKVINYLFWAEVVFVGFVPLFVYFTNVGNVNISSPLAIEGGFFFPLMGYWLTKIEYIKRITREQLVGAWILTFCCYAIMISVTLYQATIEKSAPSQSFYQTFQAIPCMTFFLSMVVYVQNRQKKQGKRVLKDNFVKLSYGIILVAGLVMEPLQVVYNFMEPIIGNVMSSIVWVLVTMLVSYLLSALLSHTYGVSKLFVSVFMNGKAAKGNR